jgi:oxygen-independent coproporphyrinogen-3 oxidase
MAGSLYIHVPFCLTKCSYCDFLSIAFDEAVARRYLEALRREIRLRGGRKIETVYVGGGTPTVLSIDAIEEIFKTVSDYFEIEKDAEITIEANPGTLDAEKTKALADLGVNRLSIGVQSLNDKELRFLGRCHTAAEALKAIESPGFDNFSVDLIYGIPGQSMRSWQSTLKRALSSGPSHISAYELTAEPGTPFYEDMESGRVELPPEALVVEMFEQGLETFEKNGLLHYEISNFARPGLECRHNLNYWKRGDYVGLGAGAHSFEGGRRMKNTGYVFKYIESLSKGLLPVEESVDVSAEDEIKEIIFLGLRMTRGIDASKMRFVADAAEELIEDGLMSIEGGRLKLTRKGLLLANAVAVSLFEKLGLG